LKNKEKIFSLSKREKDIFVCYLFGALTQQKAFAKIGKFVSLNVT